MLFKFRVLFDIISHLRWQEHEHWRGLGLTSDNCSGGSPSFPPGNSSTATSPNWYSMSTLRADRHRHTASAPSMFAIVAVKAILVKCRKVTVTKLWRSRRGTIRVIVGPVIIKSLFFAPVVNYSWSWLVGGKMLSTLQGNLDSRSPAADNISVSDFMKEAWDDYNSPTTSTFVLRLGQCRSTVSSLEEVGVPLQVF